ncbi:MAG: hypothetical protein JWM47_3356 [Acidimicrobiales bacterium]|nr:hypothetical protein [Acidimicrobiales bacterium]
MLEAAIVLPIFFLLILGLIDIGMAVFQSSEATSAAGDGARVALLHYARADVANSSDAQAISQAIHKRLTGQTINSLTVSCTTAAGASVACSAAQPGTDKVQVQVSWQFHAVSFVGAALGTKNITGSVTAVIVGAPT